MNAVPRHRLIRWTGFTGAVLLALAAHFGGALPAFDPAASPVSILTGAHGPLILGAWLAGTALMTGAWWAARSGVPSLRWAGLTTGLWLLPLLVAPPLGSRDVYPYACQGAAFAAGRNPYQVSAADLPCQWLDSISPIWRDTPAPYGPLFVVLAGAAVAAGGALAVVVALLRVIAVLGVGLTALCLPVLARRCGVPEDRALWLALACPLVGVHLVSGAHNDALMIGLLVAGLTVVSRPGARPLSGGQAADRHRRGPVRASWRDSRPALLLAAGGALLGLAVTVKVTAAVVVPFAVLVAQRHFPGPRALVRAGAAVAGGALGAVLAVTYASGLGFGWVGGLAHSGESVQWTAPATAVGLTIGYAGRLFGADLDAVPATRAAGVAVLAVILSGLFWRARQNSPLRSAGWALAVTVALAPVFHPWYATWPLVVLAATSPATGRRLWWFAGPCAAACFLVLPDGTALARFSRLPGALAMTALVVAVAVVAGRAALPGKRRPAVPAGPGRRAEGAPGGDLPRAFSADPEPPAVASRRPRP